MHINFENLINKNNNFDLIVDLNDTVSTLKYKIISNFPKLFQLSIERLGIYTKQTINGKNSNIYLTNFQQKLVDYDVKNNSTLYIKDLGPQISWRAVYIVEYIGPIFIILFWFLLNKEHNSNIQKMLFLMSTFHYLKRLFESIFLHKFSNPTMPLKNLFINCIYYWGIYGLFCGYNIFNSRSNNSNSLIRWFFVFLFFCSEIKNLKCHLILSELKNSNTGSKGIPYGQGFELVSCANYFWEFCSWLNFSIFSLNISCFIFTFIGLYMMHSWAHKKHKLYKEIFGDKYPKSRKAMIPYIS